MSTTIAIAASGMVAAQTRLEVSAHNIANAPTHGSSNDDVAQAFAALRVDQVALSGGGTAARASKDTSATRAVPPSVELSNELVQQMIARYTFAANANIMRIAAQMEKAMINTMA